MNEQILDDNFTEKKTPYLDNLTQFDRFRSMFWDHTFLCLTIIPFLIFLEIILGGHPANYSDITIISFLSIYLNKDILNGRSFAKRYLGQIIIDNKSGAPASELKCLIRNLTIPFWFIEIFFIISPSRRFGDFIAGTKVVRVEKATLNHSLSELKNAKKRNWVLVFILAFFYINFLLYIILFPIL